MARDMKTFKQHLDEKVLSIGLNPKHDELRQKHEDEIHDVIKKAYSSVEGGYGGLNHPEKESEAIRADIRNKDHVIKAVRRNGKINSAIIYKKKFGRKAIALGSDGTREGKMDLGKTVADDNKQKRSWAELSGAAENFYRKRGYPVQPSSKAKKLTGKDDVEAIDTERYSRKIGGHKHTKTILGHPKETD